MTEPHPGRRPGETQHKPKPFPGHDMHTVTEVQDILRRPDVVDALRVNTRPGHDHSPDVRVLHEALLPKQLPYRMEDFPRLWPAVMEALPVDRYGLNARNSVAALLLLHFAARELPSTSRKAILESLFPLLPTDNAHVVAATLSLNHPSGQLPLAELRVVKAKYQSLIEKLQAESERARHGEVSHTPVMKDALHSHNNGASNFYAVIEHFVPDE